MKKRKPKPPKENTGSKNFISVSDISLLFKKRTENKYKLNQNSKNPLRSLDLFSLLKTIEVWFFSGNIFIE